MGGSLDCWLSVQLIGKFNIQKEEEDTSCQPLTSRYMCMPTREHHTRTQNLCKNSVLCCDQMWHEQACQHHPYLLIHMSPSRRIRKKPSPLQTSLGKGLHALKGLSTQRDFAQRFRLRDRRQNTSLHPQLASLHDPHQQSPQIFEHCPNSHKVSNASVLRSRCLRPRVHFPRKVEESPAWIIAIISQLSISCLFTLNPGHVLHNGFHDIISLTD